MKHITIGGGKECPELLEKEACIVEGQLLQPCPRYCVFCAVFSVIYSLALCAIGMLTITTVATMHICGVFTQYRVPY